MLRKVLKPKLIVIFVVICTVSIIIVGYFFNLIQPLVIWKEIYSIGKKKQYKYFPKTLNFVDDIVYVRRFAYKPVSTTDS